MSAAIHATAYVHPSSIVDDGATVEEGAKVWHFVHVCKGARIGARAVLGQGVFVGNDVSIGAGVKVQNNVSVYAGVTVEDDAFLGPSCVFTNVFDPRAYIEKKTEFRTTLVKKGATVGANATIVCGHSIGRYAFVGAGAVVTKDVPDFALVMGNPARHRGYVCQCGVKLPELTTSVRCGACKRGYALRDGRCVEVEGHA